MIKALNKADNTGKTPYLTGTKNVCVKLFRACG